METGQRGKETGRRRKEGRRGGRERKKEVAFMLERSNYVKGRARGRLNTSLYGRSRLAKGGG